MRTPGLFFPTTVEALYSAYHSWLGGWLHRRVGNADPTADLAHDTFTRLLGSERVRPAPDEPLAFPTTVAMRLVSNPWRGAR